MFQRPSWNVRQFSPPSHRNQGLARMSVLGGSTIPYVDLHVICLLCSKKILSVVGSEWTDAGLSIPVNLIHLGLSFSYFLSETEDQVELDRRNCSFVQLLHQIPPSITRFTLMLDFRWVSPENHDRCLLSMDWRTIVRQMTTLSHLYSFEVFVATEGPWNRLQYTESNLRHVLGLLNTVPVSGTSSVCFTHASRILLIDVQYRLENRGSDLFQTFPAPFYGTTR